MKKYMFMLSALVLVWGATLAQYPVGVAGALKMAGNNRGEIEKAITYFKKQKDSRKLKALYFLISNMGCQQTASYNWQYPPGKIIPFNELDYKNVNEAQLALNKLRQAQPKMQMVAFTQSDLKSMKAAWLIENINLAFAQWQLSGYQHIPFEGFCEYILPYRISVEPYQPWRAWYGSEYKWLSAMMKTKGMLTALSVLKADQRKRFEDTWGQESRSEPLPRLGAMQLVFRKKGMCEDGVAFAMFAMRSQGIACAQNLVPFWATSTGSHFFLTIFDRQMKGMAYDQTDNSKALNRKLIREPGKVLQLTFSIRYNTLAAKVKQTEIPDGALRLPNYIDVTANHWPVADVGGKTGLTTAKIIYACVFNGLKWRPIWWSENVHGTFSFTKMSKGAVYLPCIWQNKKMVAVADPIALGYHNLQTLNPDKSKLKPVLLAEQEGYLRLKPGTSYKLYYWDKKWIMAGRQQPTATGKQLLFNAVPANALYLLLPDRPLGKERPFIITPNGERVWF